MSPVASLEVRWILPGALPADVERWFRESPAFGPGGARGAVDWPRTPAGEPAWRDDRYRVVPGADDMGIKWREDQLQVKGREAALGSRRFGGHAEGLAERWIKWSYAGDAVTARWGPWFEATRAVARVEKCRVLRKLEVSDAAREVPANHYPERVVAAELTRLRLDDASAETHWTLGFEAAPASDAALEAAFAPAVAAFLEPCPAALPRERSLSYPAWLLGARG